MIEQLAIEQIAKSLLAINGIRTELSEEEATQVEALTTELESELVDLVGFSACLQELFENNEAFQREMRRMTALQPERYAIDLGTVHEEKPNPVETLPSQPQKTAYEIADAQEDRDDKSIVTQLAKRFRSYPSIGFSEDELEALYRVVGLQGRV